MTTASESRLFDSVVRALGLYRGDPGPDSKQRHAKIFSYALLCYGYHVVRWGLVRYWTFVRLKRLSVIIYDEFFEEGELYEPGTLTCISL